MKKPVATSKLAPPVVVLSIVAIISMLGPPRAGAQSLAAGPQEKPQTQGQSGGLSEAALELTVKRLFRSLLNREPSYSEAGRATFEVRNGRIDSVVDALVKTAEYRRIRSTSSAASLLGRMFNGLLDRGPSSRELAGLAELRRGRDAAIVGNILRSDEFRRILERADGNTDVRPASNEPARPSDPSKSTCLQALEAKMGQDYGRDFTLRSTGPEAKESSLLYRKYRGAAEVQGSSATVTYSCKVDRLAGDAFELRYEVNGELDGALSGGQEGEPVRAEPGLETTSEEIVTCESIDGSFKRCEIDPNATVSLDRQLSTAACIEGTTWGRSSRSIWVSRGCRADFKVVAAGGKPEYVEAGLGDSEVKRELDATGWGFIRRGAVTGAPGNEDERVWLNKVSAKLLSNGTGELQFEGDDSLRVSGRWFGEGEKIEFTVSGPFGSDRPAGAGSIYLSKDDDGATGATDGRLARVQLAGRGAGRFDLLFVAEEERTDLTELEEESRGEGEVALANGRRARLTTASIDLRPDGSAIFQFSGETRLSMTGTWFPSVSESIELAIDGLGEQRINGGGTIRLHDGQLHEVTIAGVSQSPFRLRFEADH